MTVQKEEEVAAATTLQKHVRGWLVRVKWQKVTLPMLLLHQRMSVKVMEDLVAEYLRDEFIPDLLIEIFTHEGAEYEAVSEEEQRVHAIAEDLAKEVLHEEVTKVVTQYVRHFVMEFAPRAL